MRYLILLWGDDAREAALARPRRHRHRRAFVETKEQLGGLFVVELDDEREALEIARSMPASPGLVVQVCPMASV